MVPEVGDGDGRVRQHPRGLEVHPAHLYGVRGGDHARVLHLEPGHERRHHLAGVHWLLDGVALPLEEDDEDDHGREADAGDDRADHPQQAGAPRVREDVAAVVDVVADGVRRRGTGHRRHVRLYAETVDLIF